MSVDKQMEEVDLDSIVISRLRFPMVVLVLLLHTNVLPYGKDSHALQTISMVLSRIVASCAVPVFFFMSGYLFFRHVSVLTPGVYRQKLKSRFHSLLIPYVLWIGAWILGCHIIYNVPVVTNLLHLNQGGYSANSIGDVVRSFWAYYEKEEGTYPRLGQFWYIRDLMVVVLFSPVIFIAFNALRKFGFLLAFVFVILWVRDIQIPGVGRYGLSN